MESGNTIREVKESDKAYSESRICDTDPAIPSCSDHNTSLIEEHNLPSTSGSMETTNKKLSGRNKNPRARKCIVKDHLKPKMLEISAMEVEIARAEYMRFYVDHRNKSLDEATPLVDHDILIQIAASTASSFDRFSKSCQTTKRRVDRESDKNEGSLKKDAGCLAEGIHALPNSKKKRRKVSRSPSRPKTPEFTQYCDDDNAITDAFLDNMIAGEQKDMESIKEETLLSKSTDVNSLEYNGKNPENILNELKDTPVMETILTEENQDSNICNLKIEEYDLDPTISTNIGGWSVAEISSYFRLRMVRLEIVQLSQSQISENVECLEKEQSVTHEDTGNLASSLSPRSPAACEPHSQRYDSNSPEGDLSENKQAIKRKKTAPGERCCAECGRWMANCTNDWLEDLGVDSVWCSMTCIEGRVEKARMVMNDATATISLMRADGHVLPSGPVLSHLASFLRQCPDFVPILPTRQPETKTSNSGTESSRASKVLSKDSDQIRLNVRRALSDALLTRVKRAGSVFRMKDCKEVSERLEMELFRVCKQNASLPRYKMWCKHFLTQVKEIRNKGFFYRILSGQLSVQKAASLDPEQLSSAEYATPPSEGNKNASNDADSPSAIRAPMETIEDDNIVDNSEYVGEKTATKVYKRTTAVTKPSTSTTTAGSTLDAILGDGKTDTTVQHLSHFYDANCSICLAKQKTMAEQERREREEKEKARVQEKKRRESRKIFGVEREGDIPDRFAPCSDFSMKDSSLTEQMNTVKDSPKSTCAAYDSDGDYGGAGDSPIFTDSWKGTIHREEDWRSERPERSESWRDGVGRPGSSQSVLAKFDPNPWDRSLTVWHGQVSMGQMTIVSSLSVLSNPVAFQLSTDLPTSLKIKGRIQPIIVFDYLSSLRKAGMKDVIVMQLEKPLDMEGERRFLSLFDDMLSKDRYLVFDVPDDSNIKDGYLLPLPARQEAPAVLLPFDGPGIAIRHPDMVVCVMVRHRSKEWGRQIISPTHVSNAQKEDISVSPSRVNSQNSQNKDSPRTDIASRGSDDALWSGMSNSANIPSDCKSVKSNVTANFAPNIVSTLPDSLAAKVSGLLAARKVSEDIIHTVKTEVISAEQTHADSHEDSLLPTKFFEMLRKDKDSTTSSDRINSVVPNQDEIETLPDLLLFIQLTNNPKEIKEVVARFMRNPTLTEKDRDVIRKKVMEKIQSEKRRKAESKKLTSSNNYGLSLAQEIQKPECVLKSSLSSRAHQEDCAVDRPFSPSDFDSSEKPTSFIGIAGDLLTKLRACSSVSSPPLQGRIVEAGNSDPHYQTSPSPATCKTESIPPPPPLVPTPICEALKKTPPHLIPVPLEVNVAECTGNIMFPTSVSIESDTTQADKRNDASAVAKGILDELSSSSGISTSVPLPQSSAGNMLVQPQPPSNFPLNMAGTPPPPPPPPLCSQSALLSVPPIPPPPPSASVLPSMDTLPPNRPPISCGSTLSSPSISAQNIFHSQQTLFTPSLGPSLLCGPPPSSTLLRSVPGVVPVSPPSVPSFFPPPPMPPQFRNTSMMVPPGPPFTSGVPSRPHAPPPFAQATYNMQKSAALSLYSAVAMAPPPPAQTTLNASSTSNASMTGSGQPQTFQAEPEQMPSVVSGYLPENHGAAGFGGKRDRRSYIDYFNQMTSTGVDVPPIPAQFLEDNEWRHSSRPTMPGLGRSRKGSDDVPRTPTPSPPRSQHRPLPGAKPGLRPGAARPGAGLQGKRILPGARIPPRSVTPDAQELRRIEREAKRRECEAERQKEREERERLLVERGEERERKRQEISQNSVNEVNLGELTKKSPAAVTRWHTQQDVQCDSVTNKETEAKVNAELALQSSDSDMSLSEETNFNGSTKSSLRNSGSTEHNVETQKSFLDRREECTKEHNQVLSQKWPNTTSYDGTNYADDYYGESFESNNRKKYGGIEREVVEDSGEDRMDVCDDGEANISESEYLKKDIIGSVTSFGEMPTTNVDPYQKHEKFALKHKEGDLEGERSTDWTNTDWTEGHSTDWSTREKPNWEWNHCANDEYAGRYGGQKFANAYTRGRSSRGHYFRYGNGYNSHGGQGNRCGSGTGPWRPPMHGYPMPPRGLPPYRAMHSSNPRIIRGRSGMPHPQVPRGIRSRPPVIFPRGRGGSLLPPPPPPPPPLNGW